MASVLCFIQVSELVYAVEVNDKRLGVLRCTAGIWRYQDNDETDEYGGTKYSRDLKEAERMIWEETQKCDEFFSRLGL